MASPASEFYASLVLVGGVVALGAARFYSQRRFRVRRPRPRTAAHRRADAAFVGGLAVTAVGWVSLLAARTGVGPGALGRVGQVVTLAGVALLLVSGGVAIRESFRRGRSGRRRSRLSGRGDG